MAGEIFREVTEILLPRLETPSVKRTSGTFVIATVRGDIHDIGKNIAGLPLETHAFTVVDLGADVPAERIAETVVRLRPDALLRRPGVPPARRSRPATFWAAANSSPPHSGY